MLKKELKLLAQHKSVETTKEVLELICNVQDGVPTKKIVVTFQNGETRVLQVTPDTKYYDVKQWLTKLLDHTAMVEVYSKNHPKDHIKDTFHRLGGLTDLWTLFLIFKDDIII